MDFSSDYKGRENAIIDLFTATFTASEGAEEGRLIGKLVQDLFAKTKSEDLFVFSAWDGGAPVGCIFFTPLIFDREARRVFLLSPVAVATDRQGQGIGQTLLNHGLKQLRANGIDVAMTYGDPNYYSKVGFAQISEDQARAPLKLNHPEGWLAQSLTDRPLTPLQGASTCVEALNSPDYW